MYFESALQKTSSARLAPTEKRKFTFVNDRFSGKHNAAIGVFLQALITLPKRLFNKSCNFLNGPFVIYSDNRNKQTFN